GAVGDKGFETVRNAHDPNLEGDLFGAKPVRVSRAIEPLVVMAHDREKPRKSLKPGEDLLAEDRVALEHGPLLGRELTRFRDDPGGQPRVSDIAKERAEADRHPGRFVEAERAADLNGARGDALSVARAGPIV